MNRSMLPRVLGVAGASLVLLTSPLVGAESSTLAAIRQRDVLIIGNKQTFPLFNIKDPDTGRNQGFFADLARALAKQILGDENKVTFTVTTDEDRFPKLADAEVDLLIDTIPLNDEKQKVADFSDETYVSGSALLVLKGSPIQNISDLTAGTRVAYVKANHDIAVIRSEAPAATCLEFETSGEALLALKEGRADAFTQVVTHLYRAASQDARYTLVGRFTTKPYLMFIRKGDSAMQDYLNGFLQTLRTSGDYDRLYQKWFGPYGGGAVR